MVISNRNKCSEGRYCRLLGWRLGREEQDSIRGSERASLGRGRLNGTKEPTLQRTGGTAYQVEGTEKAKTRSKGSEPRLCSVEEEQQVMWLQQSEGQGEADGQWPLEWGRGQTV